MTVRTPKQGVVSGWLGAAREDQPPDESLKRPLSWAYEIVVETTGLEPAAPCLQSSTGSAACSPASSQAGRERCGRYKGW